MNDNQNASEANVVQFPAHQTRSFYEKALIESAKVLANAGMKLLLESANLLIASGEKDLAETITKNTQDLLNKIGSLRA